MKILEQKNNVKNINSVTDFTLISPLATVSDIKKHCNIAVKNRYFSVCVNPSMVEFAVKYLKKELLKDVIVCSVVGFPLGENCTATKLFETKKAFTDGAEEVDVVVSISHIKAGDYAYVKNELSRIVRIAKKKIVKAIIETPYLTKDEIIKTAKICVKARVDFIQTASGFSGGGAIPEVVELLVKTVGTKCKIKASGGVSTKIEATDLLRAGASRIGTSRIF